MHAKAVGLRCKLSAREQHDRYRHIPTSLHRVVYHVLLCFALCGDRKRCRLTACKQHDRSRHVADSLYCIVYHVQCVVMETERCMCTGHSAELLQEINLTNPAKFQLLSAVLCNKCCVL